MAGNPYLNTEPDMNDQAANIQNVFAKNRAEELGYDLWEYFVIPPFYNTLDVDDPTKPRLFIGGRGCGKTMLLRYWSHQSAFSPKRHTLSAQDLKHIGLYWRADTQFASAMSDRNIAPDTWAAAFTHMAALIIGMEVINSLFSVADNPARLLSKELLTQVELPRLKAFDPSLPTSIIDLRNDLKDRLRTFESWVNDVRKAVEPTFLPGRNFILALIEELRNSIPAFATTTFLVFVDEYENLCPYQQEIINTWLKHSEAPLIFNIAMKRHAFETLRTTGPESLSDIHDFRTHDLEGHFSHHGSETFFAEIFLLKLVQVGLHEVPIVPEELRMRSKLSDRSDPVYREKAIRAVEALLPDVSQHELADKVFKNAALSKKLLDRISSALAERKSDLIVNSFVSTRFPEASIIMPALLIRKRNTPEEIATEFGKLEAGKDNKFTGRTNWIQNNFVGSLLQLYEPYDRACPLYAGFHTFLRLSRGNIRHFLELCHK
jgi:hypothetical protein